MPVSNYSNGFPNGITIKDVPLLMAQNGDGNDFWVDSVKGSDGNKGTFTFPFATLDYAVGRCTADQGDIIFVAAGHTESIIAAAGLALDVAGITIICLGEGSNRATIDFGTDVAADMDVDAANIKLINPRFTASIDALTGPIDVNAANFKIVNAEYYDGTSIDTTDCLVAVAAATGLKIHGWKYIPGDEGGTQKESNIQVNGVDNLELIDINSVGDFGTGNIENVTDEILNVFISDIYVKNTNAGPIPGIVLDANCTGYADRVNIRIDSGTTYVSNVAKLNWSSTCLGYNSDGGGGDPIGTAVAASIEGKIDSIIAETDKIDSATLAVAPVANSLAAFIASGGTALGTELADSKSLVDVLGSDGTTVTDSAVSVLGATGANNANNAFDSSAIVANADGSVLERQEALKAQTDKIDGITLAVSPVANSLAAFIASGGTALGTELADSKSLIDVLGSDGTTVTDSAVSVLGATGANNANNAFDSSTVAANADGSVLERQEAIQASVGLDIDVVTTDTVHGKLGTDTELADRSVFDLLGGDGFAAYPAAAAPANDVSLAEVVRQVYDDVATVSAQTDKIDGVTLAVDPVANSLAAFIASGGTALGTELADSKSLIDVLGSDGTTVTDSAVSVLGATGANNANNAFDSSAVVANADGSVLERQEAIMAQTDKIDGVTLAVAPVANSLAAFIASGGTALGTELSDSKSLIDAMGSDGTTLSYGSGSMLGAIGTVHTVQKTLVSSAVVQAGVDITAASSGGDLLIEDIVMSTDGTGLAAGTNITIESDNANGIAIFFAETVANLGTNKTVSLAAGSVTSIAGVVLEAGKKLTVKATVADCTGVGEIDMTVKFRRLAAGATVAAA